MGADFFVKVPVNNMTSDPVAFLKEISSDGNVNTIDFIFQSWPIFLSLNPTYLKLLLEPVMQYSQAGRWPQPYVIHDIGTRTYTESSIGSTALR